MWRQISSSGSPSRPSWVVRRPHCRAWCSPSCTRIPTPGDFLPGSMVAPVAWALYSILTGITLHPLVHREPGDDIAARFD